MSQPGMDEFCHNIGSITMAADAIRLLMLRIADEQRLPFAVEVPNAATQRAMTELRCLLRKAPHRPRAMGATLAGKP